ncbi:hypothetical protein IQ278_12065 [Tolypothrix sp. LEGE 11397]|uniref:hypothetical protein n=1 Tax=Tolypothrix sp. LEGE 11397 TaxID=2777971 RepID=UPI0018818283|nr:hypothetical protein [Tolypothrix sp. LEGE 11397]MBE9082849.1 hypothetical protein [Tolypothrix sp. LEGE 11397]
MLLSAYLFLVVFSFLLWLTTPEKPDALEIEEDKNVLQKEDLRTVEYEYLNKEDGGYSQFPIPIEKIRDLISHLNSRNARIVAKKLGIKQRVGKRNRTKAELLTEIFQKLETQETFLMQSLNELKLLTIN